MIILTVKSIDDAHTVTIPYQNDRDENFIGDFIKQLFKNDFYLSYWLMDSVGMHYWLREHLPENVLLKISTKFHAIPRLVPISMTELPAEVVINKEKYR